MPGGGIVTETEKDYLKGLEKLRADADIIVPGTISEE